VRSESEMLQFILAYARQHDEVRAVVMNGSRANPNVRPDPFQDYDIIYFVREVAPFVHNPEVPAYFGEMMILQMPEHMGTPPPTDDGHECYLMQFMDGNRIDLSFYSLEELPHKLEDSLTIVLLDKDGLLGEVPLPSELSYLPQKPTAKAFDDCCNEFWWLNPYVAKGLWRDELTYAHDMLDAYLREQLMKMLTWYCGMKCNFQQSVGKLGKRLKDHLSAEQWALLERTYANAQPDQTWEALFAIGELFRQVARPVAQTFDFHYPTEEDRKVSEYIKQIRATEKLPPE